MPTGDDDEEPTRAGEATTPATPARKLLRCDGRMPLLRAPFPFVAAVLGALVLVRATDAEPKRLSIVAVDRLVASPSVYVGRRVRLDGEVLPGHTTRSDGACVRRFVLERNGVHVTVEPPSCEAGLVDGATVFAEGTLTDDGRFDAFAIVNRDPSPRGH